ncbi:MAG: hypothetical protein RLZZ440_2918 [Planctomycetota bacterium]|jgi:hypothetical protein
MELWRPVGMLAICLLPALPAQAVDVSLPATLQYFESTYESQFVRTADIFLAGYGRVWIPPPGRASSGNGSVGYDPRDRFDLGTWDDRTLYGSESGLRLFAERFERTGGAVIADLVWNHNGFQYDDTSGFLAAGGYPGMVLQNPDGDSDPFGVPGTNGDFHSPYAGGYDARFGGLIDIDHASNHSLIRNPVEEADPRNIPAGTGIWFGETFNLPDSSNARFYPDRDLPPIMLFNPATGQADIPIYPFNRDQPLAGDPIAENALGYLMRNAQWLVQDVGLEGFRHDIPWHFPEWVMPYFDQAVYRASERRNLDGSQYHVFSFMEAGDGPQGDLLRRFVRKSIDPADPGRVGSNYDALDFNFLRSVKNNLSGNGLQNDWRSLVYTSLDHHDDGLMNGSAGIKFVQSHDDTPATLNNVAHAYLLMLPGHAKVFFNAKQHGDGRDFPRNGRSDALGGVYGDTVTTLLDIRTSHGRGDFRERWLDKETYVFERGNAALVGLSNRLDGGFTERRVDVDFAWGTTLVELTGNAAMFADIPELVTVDDDFWQGPRRMTVRVPHNDGGDQGYVIYGLAAPRSAEGVTFFDEGVPARRLDGAAPEPTDHANGRERLADLHVVSGNRFTLALDTQPVTLHGTRLENGQLVARSIRDRDADGDNALFKVNGGLDLNGRNPFGTPSGVDFDSGDLAGFEAFGTLSRPGYAAADGTGRFVQEIETSLLPEGENYVTVRVFRHRQDGGPAVWSDHRSVLYVDRLAPRSGVAEVRGVNEPGSGDHDILLQSLDLTANNVHLFTNLPAAVTDDEILSLARAGQGRTERVDTDLFRGFAAGLPSGNNVFTAVSFEITGTSNVQRFTGQRIASGPGLGFGDLDHDGLLSPADLTGSAGGFLSLLLARDSAFNPAGDFDGDGRIAWADVTAFAALVAPGPLELTEAFTNMLLVRGDVDQNGLTDSRDIDAIFARTATSDWWADVDNSGIVGQADVDALVEVIFGTKVGDADLDGRVDVFDLLAVSASGAYGTGARAGWAAGDFSGDGIVDIFDLTRVALSLAENPLAGQAASDAVPLNSFGSSEAVPEPRLVAVAALLLAAVQIRRARRRRLPCDSGFD